MKKLLFIAMMFVLAMVGCAEEEEAIVPVEGEERMELHEETIQIDEMDPEEIVLSIHDDELTAKDLYYEMKRLELIAFIQGEEKPFEEISPKVAVQEFIQNHVIHMTASEKGIAVNTIEQEERADATRSELEAVDGYEEIMDGIDEEYFWSKEELRYETIIEAEQLVQLLMEDLQKENQDNNDERALRFDAMESFDDLIQERISELDIELNL